jgi:hypothetical protein
VLRIKSLGRLSKSHSQIWAFSFILGVMGFLSQSRATDIVFTDRTAFENALGANLKMESFESFPVGASGLINGVLHATDFSAHAIPGSGFTISTGYLSGGYPTSGNQWIGQVGTVIYEFNKPTRAFAADFIDYGDGGSGTLNVGLDTRTPFQVAATPRLDLNYLFWGVISDTPFKSVTVENTNNNESMGLDKMNFTIENVPEPSTWALGLISSVVAMLLATRKQRS